MRALLDNVKHTTVIITLLIVFLPVNDSAVQILPAPEYTVDPYWPKVPFLNAWLIQGVPTITTDANDHILAISRTDDLRPDESMATYDPPCGDCYVAAPEILEFDSEGNLHNAWGGPG